MNADQKAASSDCNVSTQNGLGMFQEYLLESNISGELLQGLLTDETYADDWAITKFQEPVWRQYFFWDMVLKTIEESQSLTFKENLPIVLSNLGFNNVNVSPFVRKIRNRVMVIVKKDNKLLGKDFALNLNSELDNLGPFCNEVGITLKWLENPCEIPIKTEIKKGLILEFRKAKIRFGFSVKQCSQWENLRLKKKYHVCENKLSELSVRNVNKRIKRKQKKIVDLQKENIKMKKEILFTKLRANEIRKKYKVQSALMRYYKSLKDKKVQNTINLNETIDLKQTIKNSKERIEFLEKNENMNLQEEITEFKMSFELNQIVQTFHNGKYNDTVREVYAALLSLNVGVNNVEKVVRTVLEKLGGLKVERLPKRTFSEIMLVEAKALAQMQAAEAMLTSECNTLHTDGTKRGGHEFGGVQVGTSFGQFSLGINEMVRGDAESFQLLIDSVLTDMSKILVKNSDANLCKESRSKLILSIKNMMTDRHIVNQSLKSLLEKMKIECLPTDDDTDMDLIKKMSAINGFKCNLHVLVNFATQAEASTKLCVPGADEKSGYGLLFKTFLNQLEPPVDLQLTTFHGHRINLLFSMGASVFHHRNHIKLFIENYFNKEDRNRLLCAVYNYVNNPVYLAGCRALGIVDKLLTGPLWRIIENVDHILDLNDIWLVFKNCIELLSKDASELIEGKVFYPEFTKKDEVFNSLFINNDLDEELNLLTIEALQIILINFLIIIERQLSDCLPGGIFNENTEGVNKDLRVESTTVATTNIVSERDFANLDRLRREKPNANTIALEGIILFSNNKTLRWLDDMNVEKKAEVFKIAREKTPEIIKQFRKRKEEIKKNHMLLLKQRKEEKERKALKKQEEVKALTIEIQKYGGLWLNLKDLNLNLKKSEDKSEAVKTQIKFHKKVLKTNTEDKTLLQFSANSIQFNFEELLSHLKVLINFSSHSKDMGNEEDFSNDNENFIIKSASDRLIFMEKQREIILQKICLIKNKKRKDVAIVSQEPVTKKARGKSSVINSVISCNNTNIDNDIDSSSDYVLPNLNFQCGQYVAVAYADTWYPGQILGGYTDIRDDQKVRPQRESNRFRKTKEQSNTEELTDLSQNSQTSQSIDLSQDSQISNWSDDVGLHTLNRINTALVSVSKGSFSPLKYQLETPLDKIKESTLRYIKRKANQSVDCVMEAIAPGQGVAV
ncbi:unnamed protein product [Mytilus coruscus]|uniref:Uncharacterized protein n=1 Tax=Mytilus coruscus TaxID=42192 RepID=A0A6J8A4B8_MYTCO|nr:unnamed protein product [Mytilus coruscus]